MSISPEKRFSKYYRIRNDADRLAGKLAAQHESHMVCRKGCDSCCMDFGLLPVEFFAILDRVKEMNLPSELTVREEGGCPFLLDHSCLIYSERPLICRTHGLPLLQMGNEEWELSACPLNFTLTDGNYFTMKNSFPSDRYNSRLYMANLDFIGSKKDIVIGENELIPLSRLPAWLKK